MFPVRVYLLLIAATISYAATPDMVIFDEDDPLGLNYYDASIGRFTEPSSLKLMATSRDKMPVTTNSAAVGRNSGVIEWASRSGGTWTMHIFRPGFGRINLARHESLRLALNGPAAISPDALPIVEFQDARGGTMLRPLREVLPNGVDGDTSTWQQVNIVLSSFHSSPNFDRTTAKHVTLRQGASVSGTSGADGVSHVLWIDDIRLVATDRAMSTSAPPAPSNLAGRAGDRTITLRWDAVADPLLRGYHVYRAENKDGPFAEIPGSPVQIRSIADVRVENGKSCFYQVKAENDFGLSAPSAPVQLVPRAFTSDNDFLEYLQATAFDYFWNEANPQNGMVHDRTQPWSAASIAALGFGLTAIGIGIDHHWISREQGRERVLRTLRTLWNAPQGAANSGTSGHKGWFYHFLQMEDGLRYGTSELSSIDTALLLAGVLYAHEYFDQNQSSENEIRQLADQIFDRVDWQWMLNDAGTLSMGWHPERGFIRARWNGYNEASILYLMGLGAKNSAALKPEQWREWTSTYSWKTSHGYSFIHFPPLFGHQYSACWIDFRNIADDHCRAKGITYFENSRRATLAQRAYCLANPGGFQGYSSNIWGLTACDGPGSEKTHGYIARGAPPPENDDGTIAPTAAGGSLPFSPEECLAALKTMYEMYREQIWCGYGFRDAFNVGENWWGADVIGIDQGPILIMAENLRTGRVWEVMRKNEILNRGLKQAGFRPIPAETPPRK